MKRLREGQRVVFTFKGKNQLGIIENIAMIDKVRKYQVRAESGQLYPHLGIDTIEPGNISLDLTKMYYGTTAQVVEIETTIDDDTAINDDSAITGIKIKTDEY